MSIIFKNYIEEKPINKYGRFFLASEAPKEKEYKPPRKRKAKVITVKPNKRKTVDFTAGADDLETDSGLDSFNFDMGGDMGDPNGNPPNPDDIFNNPNNPLNLDNVQNMTGDMSQVQDPNLPDPNTMTPPQDPNMAADPNAAPIDPTIQPPVVDPIMDPNAAAPAPDPNANPTAVAPADPNAVPTDPAMDPNAVPQDPTMAGDPNAQPPADPNAAPMDPNAGMNQPPADPTADPNAAPPAPDPNVDPNTQPPADPNAAPQPADPNAPPADPNAPPPAPEPGQGEGPITPDGGGDLGGSGTDMDFSAGGDMGGDDQNQNQGGGGDNPDGNEDNSDGVGVGLDNMRKFVLYKSYVAFVNAITNYVSKLENVVLDDPGENQLIKFVSDSLRNIKDMLYDYLMMKFELSSYVQARTFFDEMFVAVQITFNMLSKIKKYRLEKEDKKKKSKNNKK